MNLETKLEEDAARQLRQWLRLADRGQLSAEGFLDHARKLFGPRAWTKLPGILHGGNGEWSSVPEPTWLVQNLIPREPALAVLYGESASWKSFLALDLGLAMTQGQRFIPEGPNAMAGGPAWSSSPEPVLYLAAEDSVERLKKRLMHLAAFRGMTSWPGLDVHSARRSPRRSLLLSDQKSRRDLGSCVAAEGYALVVIDTLAESVRGVSMNWEKDASLVVDWTEEIRSAGATALLIHHVRKPPAAAMNMPFDATDPDNMRGSSVLRGSADLLLASARFREHELRFRVTKSRVLEGAYWRDLVVGIAPEPEPGHESKFTFAGDFKAMVQGGKQKREEGIRRAVEVVGELASEQSAPGDMFPGEPVLLTAYVVAERLEVDAQKAKAWLTEAAKRGLVEVSVKSVRGRRVPTYGPGGEA